MESFSLERIVHMITTALYRVIDLEVTALYVGQNCKTPLIIAQKNSSLFFFFVPLRQLSPPPSCNQRFFVAESVCFRREGIKFLKYLEMSYVFVQVEGQTAGTDCIPEETRANPRKG